jgi:hypothetical protein
MCCTYLSGFDRETKRAPVGHPNLSDEMDAMVYVNEMDRSEMKSIRKLMLTLRQLHIQGYPLYIQTHLYALGTLRIVARYMDEPELDFGKDAYHKSVVAYSSAGGDDILSEIETMERCTASSPRVLAAKIVSQKELDQKRFGRNMELHGELSCQSTLSNT